VARSFRDAIRSAIGFPVTTFDDELRLDAAGTQKQAANMVSAGMTALTCAAGTGELHGLTPDECDTVYRATVEAVSGRAVVLAGVGFGPELGSQLARKAKAAGCDGLLIMPPYLQLGDERGWSDYYRTIAAATDLPCSIYIRDQVRLSTAALERLCAEVDNIVCLKDGSTHIRAFQDYRRALGDRLTWLCGAGDDWAPSYFAAGAEGFTSSVSNFDPRIPMKLFDMCASGKLMEAARFVEESVQPFFALRLRGYDVALTKAAADLAGLPGGKVRPPAPSLSDAHRQELAAALRTAALIA
jgi:5-dehydro-4-deoxyglucarate dehydratase